MNQFFKVIVLSSAILLLSSLPKFSMAQPGDPQTDPDLPIDGGVSLLVAAGAAYGIKKYRNERKKKLNKIP